ncbi:Stk1 family PASTA domain-containing Ser/Thr kinase [Cellulomonas chengniuliangii]|uniref:non-specific serine/threonine protein kinase n=1 Tax=Cellulomonas chengniuliangii TaxID=2968084 RepID=A0ABY5KXH6_9CELL|nr:Stk1 family PASTA domain-containing Ser/Thr kinase [Cellulomonas chengniuliangii]MCC2308594.1 Stk1 family PASTA domain-containing Ser/Thr kinase [Cellulomonas chengniuliangii]UUI73957.1 Stk1 family PASTA domain-containing Ser/Thr kinase [Cellulomonas chengniuliangii]
MGATVTDPLVGRLVDGRYEVVSRIARGGMATVYLAIDRRLDRDVALKVMHAHLAEGASGAAFIARFRREARAAARLTHPGLVAVLDQGVDGDMSYLTMEHIDGSTLRRHLEEQGSLTVGESLRMLEQVLDALAAAHRADLVHRDIKPENVLIASDDRVKVADFGLARAVTEVTSATTGTVLGTVAYLAPELISRGVSDTRTDVYACGILLYEMLTGRQPFTGETPIQVAFQHVNTDVPAPSSQVAWLPAEVDELVTALAARDPEDRPVHAAAALALTRRTRESLDEATLARRADVSPAPPPAQDDVDEDASEHAIGADGSMTARIEPVPAGGTVALPIGAGVRQGSASQPTARPRWLRWGIPAAVAVLLATLGTWWFLTMGPGAYTTVPALLGVTSEEAAAILDEAGLGADPSEDFSDDAAVGTVFASDPGPGEKVRKDGTVAFTVSLGPDLVVVPEGLVGAMQADAAAALEAADLVAEYAEGDHYSDDAPAGMVLEASAEPSTQVKRGSAVRLTISDGPAPVSVFSVVGLALDAATTELEAAGLAVATEPAFSDTVAKGRVISQSPEGGAAGHRGDTVTLTVSEGPELVEVPDLFGVQYDKAKETLEAAGFRVARENVLGGLFGTVREQSVAKGQKAPKGTEITLKVV